MTEEHVFDLLPGYALGILDDEELLKAVQHLSGCARCRRELESFSATADGLVYAVPQQEPPPDLQARVAQRVADAALHAEPAVQQTVDAPARAGWRDTLRALFGRSPFTALAIGALALLVLFLGVNNYRLRQEVDAIRARIPADNVQIVQMVGTDYAPYAAGYVMVFRDDLYGSLTVENVPALEAGYQYQIWLIKDGQRASGGVFSVDEAGYGVLQIDADQPLDAFDSFGITIEPAGGSPAPTGQKVLGGDL